MGTTEDHIPARGLFLGRQWPEGYVFPACFSCNSGTRRDELLLAWLIRVRIGDYTPEAEQDFERVSLDLLRQAPEVWAAIRVHSRVETRKHIKAKLLPQTLPGISDVVYSFDIPDAMMEAANRYSSKLGKALHYLHTGRIVPADAVVKARVFSNAAAMSPQFPSQVLSILTNQAPIQRAKTSLKDQFDYRFAVVDEGRAAAFVISLGHSMLMVVAIFCDREKYELTKRARDLLRMEKSIGLA